MAKKKQVKSEPEAEVTQNEVPAGKVAKDAVHSTRVSHVIRGLTNIYTTSKDAGVKQALDLMIKYKENIDA
jgi:hypothetical protein